MTAGARRRRSARRRSGRPRRSARSPPSTPRSRRCSPGTATASRPSRALGARVDARARDAPRPHAARTALAASSHARSGPDAFPTALAARSGAAAAASPPALRTGALAARGRPVRFTDALKALAAGGVRAFAGRRGMPAASARRRSPRRRPGSDVGRRAGPGRRRRQPSPRRRGGGAAAESTCRVESDGPEPAVASSSRAARPRAPARLRGEGLREENGRCPGPGPASRRRRGRRRRRPRGGHQRGARAAAPARRRRAPSCVRGDALLRGARGRPVLGAAARALRDALPLPSSLRELDFPADSAGGRCLDAWRYRGQRPDTRLVPLPAGTEAKDVRVDVHRSAAERRNTGRRPPAGALWAAGSRRVDVDAAAGRRAPRVRPPSATRRRSCRSGCTKSAWWAVGRAPADRPGRCRAGARPRSATAHTCPRVATRASRSSGDAPPFPRPELLPPPPPVLRGVPLDGVRHPGGPDAARKVRAAPVGSGAPTLLLATGASHSALFRKAARRAGSPTREPRTTRPPRRRPDARYPAPAAPWRRRAACARCSRR